MNHIGTGGRSSHGSPPTVGTSQLQKTAVEHLAARLGLHRFVTGEHAAEERTDREECQREETREAM